MSNAIARAAFLPLPRWTWATLAIWVPDGQQRVKLAAWVRHHHGNIATADALQLALGQLQQVNPTGAYGPGCDAAGRGRQLQDRASEGCFARAGFTDEAQDLPRADRKIDVAERDLRLASDGRELDPEPLDFQSSRHRAVRLSFDHLREGKHGPPQWLIRGSIAK
jgi:hypothetical protein